MHSVKALVETYSEPVRDRGLLLDNSQSSSNAVQGKGIPELAQGHHFNQNAVSRGLIYIANKIKIRSHQSTSNAKRVTVFRLTQTVALENGCAAKWA